MALSENLKQLAQQIELTTEQSLDTLAEIGQTYAKSSKVFKGNSANGLRNNIVVQKPGAFIRDIISLKTYSHWVEEGNADKGAYIYPKTAQALRFRVDGHWVFAKRVRSHGPLRYMRPAQQFLETHWANYLEQQLNKLL